MWEDPIVQEVRREREKLSAQFDFDVDAIFADLRKRQSSQGERLVRPRRRDGAAPPGEQDRDTAGLRPDR
jgi:hypothetical protein